MTFQAGRIQGNVYRKMVMVNVYGKPDKHGRLEDLGPAGPGWHWSGYRAYSLYLMDDLDAGYPYKT